MKLVQAINNFLRNAHEMRMPYHEAFTLAAIGELTADGGHCTSPEIERICGKSKYHCYLSKLEGVTFDETKNDRGNLAFQYRLNSKGVAQLKQLTSPNAIQLDSARRKSNNTNRK